jgi:hypothetical protein
MLAVSGDEARYQSEEENWSNGVTAVKVKNVFAHQLR